MKIQDQVSTILIKSIKYLMESLNIPKETLLLVHCQPIIQVQTNMLEARSYLEIKKVVPLINKLENYLSPKKWFQVLESMNQEKHSILPLEGLLENFNKNNPKTRSLLLVHMTMNQNIDLQSTSLNHRLLSMLIDVISAKLSQELSVLVSIHYKKMEIKVS